MAPSYANDQPNGFKNHVSNIAIVGIGGRSGSFIANALLETKKHTITAITRPESTSTVPAGIHSVKATYTDHASLVRAMTGQDVLIITMSHAAPKDSQTRLIDAAIEAKVRFIMPNEWGIDQDQTAMAKETFMYDRLIPIRSYIETHGGATTSWIGLCCSFWYEFSLAGTDARYGFDFANKKVTFYNDGTTKINTSTWPQVGRAVAALLSLPVLPTDPSDNSPTLSRWANKSAYTSSFHISQRDMLDSVLRVTNDEPSSWTIEHEDVQARYARGKELMMEKGQMLGFGILLYARVFYPDGSGSFNEKLDNEVLGLPVEDLDAATEVAVKMAREGNTNAM